MNKLKYYIITLCLLLSIIFIDISGVYCSYTSNVVVKLDKSLKDDPDFIVNQDGFFLKIYDYTNNKTYIYLYDTFYFSPSYSSIHSYYFKYQAPSESFYYDKNLETEYDYDLYLCLPDGTAKYHLFVDNATGNAYNFTDFTELEIITPPEDSEDGNIINFDDTNIVNKLDNIDKSLNMFIAIFFLYFGYKIVKEIVYNVKGK